MAERAVDLPKPNTDDDEDVVDWLSTARALWARGERSDALVWLRRAAEAAAMAGQPFRASEIGMYVTALEETFGDPPARSISPPPVEAKREVADTLVDPVEAFGALASEVLRTKLTSIEVELEEDTLIEETPGALAAEQARAAPKPPPPIAPKPPPPVPASVPPKEAHEAKVIVQLATTPPPAFGPSSTPAASSAGGSVRPAAVKPEAAPARPLSAPPPPGFSPPLAPPRTPEGDEITLVSAGLRASALGPGTSPLATTPTPPVVRASPSGMAPPPPSFGLPPLEVPRPPPTPRGEGFGPLREAHVEAPAPKPPRPLSAPPPPMHESATTTGASQIPPRAPPSAPLSAPPPRAPIPSVPGSAPPPPRAPMPSSTGLASAPPSPRRSVTKRPAQRAPRQPILDPWAEDQSATPPILRPTPKGGPEEVVVFRARFPSLLDEEEVFTSAAPLPASLRRNPPSAPSSTGATGASPPPAPASGGGASPPPAPPSGGGTTIAAAPVAPPVSVLPMVPPKSAPISVTPAAPAQPGRLASAVAVPAKSVPPPAKAAVSVPPAKSTGDAAQAVAADSIETESPTEAADASVSAPREPEIREAAGSAKDTQESVAKPADEPRAKDTLESAAKPADEPRAKDTLESAAKPADEPRAKDTLETPTLGAQRKPTLLPRNGPPTIPRPATMRPAAPASPGKVAGLAPAAKAGPTVPPAAKIAPPVPPAAKVAPSTPSPQAAKSSERPATVPPAPASSRPAITNAARPATVPPAPAMVSPAHPSSRPPSASALRPAVPPAPARMASVAPATAPRPAAVRPASVVPPPHDPFDSDPLGPNAFGGDAASAPPIADPASAKEAASAPFDPARATLPMMLAIEPPERPLALPSMRATLPMPLELPKDLEAMFAETGDVPVRIEGVRLDTVDVLEGTPRAVQQLLADKAQVVELGPDEEVAGFGGAMLLTGMAILCATIVDAAAHWVHPGELLVARGSLTDGLAVRVVGAGDGAKIAVWPRGVLEEAIGAHQTAVARARAFGDRLQALAGATMGPFGEIDDDDRRALAMELSVRCLGPGEIWLEDGAPVPSIALVGAGAVELYGPISEETTEVVEPGSLVFPDLAVLGGEAPSCARAGAQGALLLVAETDVATRLSARIPDLAERLRGA